MRQHKNLTISSIELSSINSFIQLNTNLFRKQDTLHKKIAKILTFNSSLSVQNNQKKLSQFPDQTNQLFLLPSLKRTTDILSIISKRIKKIRFFIQNSKQKPDIYRQIAQVISPYVILKQFSAGDAITITGEKMQHINFLIEGNVSAFIPYNQSSYLNNIKMRNSENRNVRWEYNKLLTQVKNKSKSQFLLKKTQLNTLNIQQANNLIVNKDYCNNLTSPHHFIKDIQIGQMVALNGLNFEQGLKQYENCITICRRKTLILRLPKLICEQIYLWIKEVELKDDYKLLLNFLKINLNQENNLKKILLMNNALSIQCFTKNSQIKIIDSQNNKQLYNIYLIADGEVSIAIHKQNKTENRKGIDSNIQISDNFQRTIKNFQILCTRLRGDIIYYYLKNKNIIFFAKKNCRLIRINKQVIQYRKSLNSQFKYQFQNFIKNQNIIIQQMIKKYIQLNQNSAKNQIIKQNIKRVRNRQRIIVQDFPIIQAVNTLQKINKQKNYDQQKIFCTLGQKQIQAQFTKYRKSKSICLFLQNKISNEKIIRSKNISTFHNGISKNQKQIYKKFGILSISEITRHNFQFIKKNQLQRNSLPQIKKKKQKLNPQLLPAVQNLQIKKQQKVIKNNQNQLYNQIKFSKISDPFLIQRQIFKNLKLL